MDKLSKFIVLSIVIILMTVGVTAVAILLWPVFVGGYIIIVFGFLIGVAIYSIIKLALIFWYLANEDDEVAATSKHYSIKQGKSVFK